MQLLFALLLLVALVVGAFASTCDVYSTSETNCLKATEGGEKCAYCTSGAVGSECLKESDAKGLPSSVFKCTYAAAASSVQASSCEKNKDQTKCISSSCAWCSSAAVGDECISQSDAKDLPSSVFHCTYPSLRKN